MATIKPVLNQQQNHDGTRTLRLRFTLNRKIRYKSLFRIHPKYFNETKNVLRKSYKNAEKLNNQLKSTLEEYQNRIDYLKRNKPNYTLDDVFNNRIDSTALYSYIDIRVERMIKSEQESTAAKYSQLKNSVEGFRPNPDLSDINVKWVEDFVHYLRSQDNIKSDATVMRRIKHLKTILNDAYKDNRKVDNGARLYTVRVPKAMKDKLTNEELNQLIAFDNPRLNLAKDTFLLNYYLRGLRISDTLSLNHSNISNNKFCIVEHKTGKTRAISINQYAQEIIDRYKGQSMLGYILPWVSKNPEKLTKYKFKRHLESKTAIINKQLKSIAIKLNISKRLTTHVARHTFAHHGIKKGLDISQMQKLLGQESYRSTEEYIRSVIGEDELGELSEKIFN